MKKHVVSLFAALVMTASVPAQVRRPLPPNLAPDEDAVEAPSLAKEHKDLAPTLVELLGAKDAELRQYAAASLRLIGSEAVPALVDGLKKRNAHIQGNICYVLGNIAADNVVTTPHRTAVPHMLKLVKAGDPEVRRRAAFCLHRCLGGGAQDPNADFAFMNGLPVVAGPTDIPPDPGLLLPND